MTELRPFNLSDESAKYWNLRLSALSSLIGYGLIVAVPIISNQVNVQVGALANVVIMLCITLWALYLIFRNKTRITGAAARGGPLAGLLQSVYPRLCAYLALAGLPLLYRAVFLFTFRPRQQPEIYDGSHGTQPGDYRRRRAALRHLVTLDSENHYPVAADPAQLSRAAEAAERLDLRRAQSGANFSGLRGDYAAAKRTGLFDFWNWMQHGAGQKRWMC